MVKKTGGAGRHSPLYPDAPLVCLGPARASTTALRFPAYDVLSVIRVNREEGIP